MELLLGLCCTVSHQIYCKKQTKKYVSVTPLKMKLIAWSVKYSAYPVSCGNNIFELNVFIHSVVLYQDISVSPKYWKIQSIPLIYALNDKDILSTQCWTPELTEHREIFWECVELKWEKCDHLNHVSIIITANCKAKDFVNQIILLSTQIQAIILSNLFHWIYQIFSWFPKT